MKRSDGEIAYQVSGSGPAIVFVHGFGLDSRMWQPQIDHFSATHTVLAYDCRGFGESARPNGPYDRAADLDALLDWLSLESCTLVGCSMGGRIALDFSLHWPQRVTSLFLSGTDVGGYRFGIDWDVSVDGGLDAARAKWLEHPLFHTAQRVPEAWSLIRRMVASYSGWHWMHDDPREPADTDTLARLSEIAVPTTVLVGAEDLPDFHSIAALLERRMQNARTLVVPGVGHMVNLEAASEFNSALTRHLDDHPALR
jgi:3-oxoadipate enol-lactonase